MKVEKMQIRLREDEKLLYGLRTLYRQYGYRNFRMSKFEKYELYAGNKDFLVSDRVITFTDTDGELLALKPDVTLSIVRGTAYEKGNKEKLCYQETVYRPSGSSRQFREIMQTGLECIGDLDAYDESEVLLLAEKSLKMISEESVLSVSHLGILKGLFSALNTDDAEQKELLGLVAERNAHGLKALFERKNWDQAILEAIQKLLELNCSIRELPEALRHFDSGWLGQEVVAELKQLAVLSSGEARFDFSVINDVHYYNGIVFQGFVRGIAEKVLSGGRYDSLLRRLDRKGAAIGFAVYYDLVEQMAVSREENDADVLLCYDENTDLKDLRDEVSRLQEEGLSVYTQRICAGEEQSVDGLYGRVLELRGGEANA